MSEAERRAYVESLKGASERRACPGFAFAYDLPGTDTASYLATIKARRARLRRGERRADSPEEVQRLDEEDPPRAFKEANGKVRLAHR
jgi:hypothetical protein